MPNRILREGILTSERVCSLSWPAEVFYRRLMSVVDDFGRYYAKPSLLRAACYPQQIDKVSDADIGKWLAESQKAALVSVYQVDHKLYLVMHDFRQQQRAKASKFPHPPCTCEADASKCLAHAKHAPADAHLGGDEGVDGDEGGERPRKRGSRLPKPFELSPEWAEAAAAILNELKRPDVSPPYEFAKFCDHWWGQAGQKGVKDDWLATWRNWIRKACEYRAAPNGKHPAQDSTDSAWLEFRDCIRNERLPADPKVRAVVQKWGGLRNLGAKESKDLDFKRREFDAEYRSAA